MPTVHLEVTSASLGTTTALSAVLPESPESGSGPPTLYLIHGLGGDDRSWLRHSDIEHLAAELRLAVVLPDLAESFGVDEAAGPPYGTYLTEELPGLVRDLLGLCPPREATFVAGNSMGGYVALRWALRHPERFAAAASLSGSLDIADPDRYRRRPDLMARLFAGRGVPGTPDDLLHLLAHGSPGRPDLYVGCGMQDSHLAENRRFVTAARAAGAPLTTAFTPGGHDWPYWRRALADVLAWLSARPTIASAARAPSSGLSGST